jgi:transposase
LSCDDKKPPTGILKIRVLPTKKQIQVLKSWLGAYNLTWNKALNYIQTTKTYPSFVPLKNKFTVANPISLLGQSNPDVPDFILFTPSKIRQYAIRDLCTAFESAKTNKARGNIGSFIVQPKRKKNQKRCFSIPISKEGLSFLTMKEDKTMTLDCMGQRKTHISVFPQAMKDCFNQCQSRPPRNPNFILKEHVDYKKRIGSNEIWDDYVQFIKMCGVPYTIKEFTLRQHYKSIVGIDIWEDYFMFMMNHGWAEYIDSDYKSLYSKKSVQKPFKQSTLTTSMRFFHRKNDKLLYNLKLDYDCILKYEYGLWYLHIPYQKQPRKEPEDKHSIVGLDPGFKTFLTLYSDKMYGKIQQTNVFKHIRNKLDYYNNQYYGKKKYGSWVIEPKQISYAKFKYKTNQLYRKQSHLTMQMHYDTIRFLSQFNWILLPSFESQEMVKGKRLSKETKREASQLQHYKFKQRLQSACSSMENCKVLIVSEAYTSKTCGRCGYIKNNLTLKDRIFNCIHCGLKIDRDVNGSRNIILRNL